jgi:hypothetical protein
VGHAGDGDLREVERFGVDEAVGGNDEEFAERRGIHVGQSQGRLLAMKPVRALLLW